MKYLFIIVFVNVFCLYGIELGFAIDSPIYTHLTYMFQHASVIHLVMNSISFFFLWDLCERRIGRLHTIGITITSALLASFVSAEELPTVGASGMIYALIGVCLSHEVYKWIKEKKIVNEALIIAAGVLLGMLFSAFSETSNTMLHAAAMLLGYLFAYSLRLFRT